MARIKTVKKMIASPKLPKKTLLNTMSALVIGSISTWFQRKPRGSTYSCPTASPPAP